MSPAPRDSDAQTLEEWRQLGARLKEIREYLNLSQSDVAGATGIPRSAVSDIERGNRKVDSLELRKFSRLYRYPVGYLLGEEPDQAPATALARAVDDLTDDDKGEVLRFAEFLRYSAQTRDRTSRS